MRDRQRIRKPPPHVDPAERALAHAARRWRRARMLYTNSSLRGEPEERAEAEKLAAEHPELHDRLIELLDDPSPLVAGYALATLQIMQSPTLRELPEKLLQRKEKLNYGSAFFPQHSELGKFARQIQEYHRSPANKEPVQIPTDVSALRFMMAAGTDTEYRHCKTLSEAQKAEGSVAIMEGDYGGQIYFTCPVRHIRCDDKALSRLLEDLDALGWNDPEGRGLYFEFATPGDGIAGGMGGGAVTEGIWLHPRLEGYRNNVESVIAGTAVSINPGQ